MGGTATLQIARVRTVAFTGLEVADVDVEAQLGPGLPSFQIVGLADKAVAESRERVRAALAAMALALPPKRITVNLAPADLAKEGSHFDLPIALGLLVIMGVLPPDTVERHLALGELALDGTLRAVAGVLPAAVAAGSRELALICPAASGGEAAWLKDQVEIVAAPSLTALLNHARGLQPLPVPAPPLPEEERPGPDLRDVKGQETAKRALEIAAAGGHNLLMSGPPGAGKSMLAARLVGLLPPLDPAEMLEVSMIASVGGRLHGGRLTRQRPYRSPHHAASTAAIGGGGQHAGPGAGRGRRAPRAAGGGLPGPQGHPVPGRAAGVRPPCARGPSSTPRERQGHDRARQRARHLPGPVPARGGDESLPLRLPRRPCARLRAGPALRARLQGAAVGAAARPHRHPPRGAACGRAGHG